VKDRISSTDKDTLLAEAFGRGEKSAHEEAQKSISFVLLSAHNLSKEERTDIASDVLIAALESVRNGTYKGLGFKSFIGRITKNKLVSYWRYRSNKLCVDVNVVDIPSQEQNAEQLRADYEGYQLAKNALWQTGSPCRELLQKKIMENQDYEMIIQHFGWTYAYARKRVFQCLEKLRLEYSKIEKGNNYTLKATNTGKGDDK
jgi:DNA-directed RNA polymerase specialized sigma24 family protein